MFTTDFFSKLGDDDYTDIKPLCADTIANLNKLAGESPNFVTIPKPEEMRLRQVAKIVDWQANELVKSALEQLKEIDLCFVDAKAVLKRSAEAAYTRLGSRGWFVDLELTGVNRPKRLVVSYPDAKEWADYKLNQQAADSIYARVEVQDGTVVS